MFGKMKEMMELQKKATAMEKQLGDVLKKIGVRSIASGHRFTWGSDDVLSGLEAVRSWLVPNENGIPILAGFEDRLPNFTWEIERYNYKKKDGLLTDMPDQRNSHLMDTVRYLAAHKPSWHKPRKRNPGGAWAAMEAKRKRNAQKHGPRGVTLGPAN